MDKYRKLLKKTKEAMVEQIILSGILPVFLVNRIKVDTESNKSSNGVLQSLESVDSGWRSTGW